MSRVVRSFVLLFALVVLAAGCTSDSKPETPAPGAGADVHDHHHHHEELGPNGGHLLALADSGYQAEWTHDDEKADITVVILDADKQPAAVAYSVKFETTVGETKNEYNLTAESPDGDGLASKFTLNSGELLTAVKMAEQSAEAALASLEATLQNGTFRASVEVHDHAH